jgi:uncharacterized protein (DUF1800 family)
MPILAKNDAAHLLRRVGFGGTLAEISALTGLERAAAVDRVMDFSAEPAIVRPAVDLNSPNGQYPLFVAGTEWWISRMVTSPTPLKEKMTLFWHGHFASSFDKVEYMSAMFNQQLTFRNLGMGSFRDLTQAVAIDPAMLEYLDNATNKVGAEQENFARELMELFTMGVGLFSEADVVAMAKAWTGYNTVGWTGTYNDTTFKYNANKHDNGNKNLFGITKNWSGPEAIDEIINGSKRMICAKFIATKLFRFFAHTQPTDALITELANGFAASNMNIGALMRSILMHDEFWAPSTRYALIKSPVEFVVDVLRRSGIPVSASGVSWSMSPMGQALFQPPSVAGWGQNGYWLSTATMWGRSKWLDHMRWSVKDVPKWGDLAALAPAVAAQRIFDDLGIVEPSAGTRTQMESWLTRAKQGYVENGVQTYDSWSVQPNVLMMGCLTPEFLTV